MGLKNRIRGAVDVLAQQTMEEALEKLGRMIPSKITEGRSIGTPPIMNPRSTKRVLKTFKSNKSDFKGNNNK